MQKAHYKKALAISATQKKRGVKNNRKDVMKIQAWLTLYSLTNSGAGTATGVDEDFGSGTEKAVINLQKSKGLPQSGIVNQDTFDVLCQPMKNGFEGTVTGSNLRQLVVNVAANHVKNYPFELVINSQTNCGPWVRAYMENNEGTPWFWCMGFVQAIIDQAASQQEKILKHLCRLLIVVIR